MSEFSLKEVQKIELDILKYIKEMCDKYHLEYYLAYGTLIGAVRHKGFIPWDDDIDIWMPKSDIKMLSKIMCEDSHPYYKLVSIYNVDSFTAPLPKIIDTRTRLVQHYGFIEKIPLGIYVDIFPLDGAGNTMEEAEKNYICAHKLYKHWIHADLTMFIPGIKKSISLLRWMKHVPEKMKGINYWLKKLDSYTDQFSFKDCEYVGVLTNMEDTPKGNVFHKSILGNDTYLQFEDEHFRVPQKYDELLTIQYGDYLRLPPKEKQISHHKYDIEWVGEKTNA